MSPTFPRSDAVGNPTASSSMMTAFLAWLKCIPSACLSQDSVYDDVERFAKYVDERDGLFDYASQRQEERGEGSGSVESSCKCQGTAYVIR